MARLIGPNDGELGFLGSIGVRWMIDGEEAGGDFSLVEHPLPPRALAAPLHLHRNEDEYSYVLEGRMGAMLGDEVADDRRLFRHVILPGALPYILTGLRLGMAQAWRILVGVEMLAAVPWGLGWLIFGAREFLNTDVMLAGVAVIGIIGLALEKLVFQRIEDFTVVRWGMMT